jgi:hypothetical protein
VASPTRSAIKKTRKLMKTEEYEDYVAETLMNSQFSKAFAYAKHLRYS